MTGLERRLSRLEAVSVLSARAPVLFVSFKGPGEPDLPATATVNGRVSAAQLAPEKQAIPTSRPPGGSPGATARQATRQLRSLRPVEMTDRAIDRISRCHQLACCIQIVVALAS